MFAKSKRFPAADKHYIPGPGEYDVGTEDGNKHKRYGFLTQSGRFSEEHPEDDVHTTGTLSSEIVSKKEKSIQKEYDALVLKSKRMEATILALENEKKSIQLAKDMELADVRSKNANLQKAMNHQEKQMKAHIWQKRIEQLEIDYEKKLLEKEDQVTGLQCDLESRTIEMQEMQQAHKDQVHHISALLLESQNQVKALQSTAVQRQQEIDTNEQLRREQTEKIDNQQETLCTLEERLVQNEVTIKDLTQHLNHEKQAVCQQQGKIKQQEDTIQALQVQFKGYRQHMNSVACEQRNPCRVHVQELNQLLTELHQAKKFINMQAIHLNNLKSDMYQLNSRCKQAEQSVLDMRQDRLEQYKFYQLFYKRDNPNMLHCSSQSTMSCNEAEHLEIKINDTL